MLRVGPHGCRQALPDEMYCQSRSVDHPDHAVGQRKHALGMQVITDEVFDELMHVLGSQNRPRCLPSDRLLRGVNGNGNCAGWGHHAR